LVGRRTALIVDRWSGDGKADGSALADAAGRADIRVIKGPFRLVRTAGQSL